MTEPNKPIGDDDLQALVDGRLPPERLSEVEGYLAHHPEIAARVKGYREQRANLRDRLQHKAQEPIPARLRIANIRADRQRASRHRFTAIAAAMSWIALGLGAGWYGHGFLQKPASPALGFVASDAIAAHRTFVVDVAHPVEVEAAREEHLVQWLSRRLGKPLKAPDLKSTGFQLMGGRLLPAAQGPAAQFMYQDERGQRLTLYVRAGETGETAFRFVREGQIASFYWLDRGLGYVISGETDRDRLLNVTEAVYHQISTAPAK